MAHTDRSTCPCLLGVHCLSLLYR